MGKQAIELSYAVRFRVVLGYFGQLCLVLSALTLVPLGVSLFTGGTSIALRYLLVLVVLGLFGYAFLRLRPPRHLQANEAMVLVALIFLITPLVMSYPMMGSGLNFVDALFETVSAGTTTGLSTLPTVEDQPFAFLFARAWMQWYGGLGIVVFCLAVLTHPGLVAKRLAITENYEDDLVGGTRAHAHRILKVYGSLTIVGVVLLWLLSGDLQKAVLYTFPAVSTGGFAPHDGSLANLDGMPEQWLVTLLSVAGALSLIIYHQTLRKGWRTFLKDLQLRGLLAAGIAATLLMALCLRTVSAMPWDEVVRHAPLLALSAQTTTGFSTLDLSSLDAASKVVLILSMLIGGGVGSTAGGIKILRLLILLRLVHLTVLRTCLPRHAVTDPRLGGRRLQQAEIQEALLVILLFLMVTAVSWLPFVVLGYDPLDSLFEVVSATGTVGLSAGITGPDLPVLLKGVLCADMLMGRLEIVAWLIILFPRTWIGRRREI